MSEGVDTVWTPGWSVDDALRRAVSRTEVRFAWFRIAFCSLIVLVFFLNNPSSQHNFGARAVLELGTASFGIAVSALILQLSRRRVLGESDLRLSVSVDAIICTGGLMTNTIAPSPSYSGVFGTLDVAAVLLVVLGSIFRASWVAVLLAGVLNVVGLSLIAWMDSAHGVQPVWGKVRLFSLYLAGAVAISLFATARVRLALRRFAEAATTAERAKHSVETLLRDQHDLKSRLFDIRLNMERLAELEGGQDASVSETLQKVATRLSGFTTSLERTQFRSLSILRGLTAPELASASEAIKSARAGLSDVHLPDIVVDVPDGDLSVIFGGGTDGLALLLTHLLDNAAGGDGRTSAATVWIEASVAGKYMQLTIRDDGPGFALTQLSELGRRPARSGDKPNSSGLGLWLASRAVEAAGGTIRFSNGAEGGAEIRMQLLRARQPTDGANPQAV